MTPPLVLIAATARLTRLITTDDLGQWWVKDPIDRAAEQWFEHESARLGHEPEQPWWWKYRSGLDCPYCVGFWLGLGLLILDRRLSGRGLWSTLVEALALNYVAAHAESLLTSITEEPTDER